MPVAHKGAAPNQALFFLVGAIVASGGVVLGMRFARYLPDQHPMQYSYGASVFARELAAPAYSERGRRRVDVA